jgi:hypothetical protein
MRVILRMLVWAALGTAMFAAAYVLLPAVGPVSSDALNYSLAAKTNGTGIWGLPGCARSRRRDVWHCEVWDESQSGTDTYVVKRHGRRCWSARLAGTGGEGRPRRRVSGCVKLRHQLRLAERALN